jgi:hypothetical protein
MNIRGAVVYFHLFWTSPPAGGKWSTSHPRCFTSGKRTPSTPFHRRLDGPQSGLDISKNSKTSYPSLESNREPSDPQTSQYTNWTNPAEMMCVHHVYIRQLTLSDIILIQRITKHWTSLLNLVQVPHNNHKRCGLPQLKFQVNALYFHQWRTRLFLHFQS